MHRDGTEDPEQRLYAGRKPCVVCRSHAAAIGSKCAYCYTRAHALRRQIWKYDWFQLNFVQFSESLAARHWAIEVGLTPGDISELVKIAGRHRTRHPVSPTAEKKIRSIIAAADRLAERRSK